MTSGMAAVSAWYESRRSAWTWWKCASAMPNAGTPARSAVAGAALRALVADLLHGGHGVAQLADPLRLVLGHQADTPGQRLASTAGHAGVDQRIERLAVVHAQPGHDRHPRRREQDPRAPTLRAPGHDAAERRLCLVCDADAGAAGLLAEAADARLLGHPHLVLGRAVGQLGRCEPADHLNFVTVDADGRALREPGAGHPPGEPGPDQPLLLGPGRRWAGRTPPPPLWSPSAVTARLSHITRLHDYAIGSNGPARLSAGGA